VDGVAEVDVASQVVAVQVDVSGGTPRVVDGQQHTAFENQAIRDAKTERRVRAVVVRPGWHPEN